MNDEYFESNFDQESVKYSGFWIRFLARIIDSGIFIFIWILGFLIYLASLNAPDFPYYKYLPVYLPWIPFDNAIDISIGFLIFIILYFAGYVLYYVLMNAFLGATLGKLVTGIVIKDEETLQPISIGQAIGRFFALEFISGIALNLGFIWAAWDDEKQTWHDKLAKTVVIYKESLIPTFREKSKIRSLPMNGREFGELVFTKGFMKGEHFTLKGNSIKIGRKIELVHIHIKDPDKYVSRIQCEIYSKNKRYYIRNLSSMNTTILNDKIVKSEIPLREKDILSFGNHSAKILFF